MRIKVNKLRLLMSIAFIVFSMPELLSYLKTHCIQPLHTPEICGESAEVYLYIYIGVLVVGLGFLFISFKTKRAGAKS